MIDSINFIIHNTTYIDFKHLKKLGINIKKYQTIDRRGNVGTGYSFIYKTVHFQYNSLWKSILVQTNTHEILEKRDITVSDRSAYIRKINRIIDEVFEGKEVKLELERLDYYVDIPFDSEEIAMKYLVLYKYRNPKFAFTKIKGDYETSIYRASKRGQYNVNIYLRYKKTKNEIDKEKNILRVELQMKKAKLIKELKKNRIPRKLENYWSAGAMKEYFFGLYAKFFGKGDIYKYKEAVKVIKKSSYSEVWKNKLIKFLKKMISEDDYKAVLKSKQTYDRYVKKLEDLNINVFCMFQAYESYFSDENSIPSIWKLAWDEANNKYFK